MVIDSLESVECGGLFRIHNSKVVGSSPTPATNKINNLQLLSRRDLGVLTPMPLSYRCIGSNLAEFRITATLQQHDEHLGPKQLQVDGLSCCQIGVSDSKCKNLKNAGH